jgi:hypothetical protein
MWGKGGNMRLSDAIAMGQHLIQWDPSKTLCGGAGCAVGMALASMGLSNGSESELTRLWPWTKNYGDLGLWWEITPKFYDVHRGKMSIDQLIDWIRSVEPAEAEPAEAPAAEPGSSATSPLAASLAGEPNSFDLTEKEKSCQAH